MLKQRFDRYLLNAGRRGGGNFERAYFHRLDELQRIHEASRDQRDLRRVLCRIDEEQQQRWAMMKPDFERAEKHDRWGEKTAPNYNPRYSPSSLGYSLRGYANLSRKGRGVVLAGEHGGRIIAPREPRLIISREQQQRRILDDMPRKQFAAETETSPLERTDEYQNYERSKKAFSGFIALRSTPGTDSFKSTMWKLCSLISVDFDSYRDESVERDEAHGEEKALKNAGDFVDEVNKSIAEGLYRQYRLTFSKEKRFDWVLKPLVAGDAV